ncbi:hypothetical protein C2G38_2230440 [Gigaspora rosea]|uniref:Uncharacterized protein n=1 Tax=Gigaspora rosea TaxID=44941 RepID=A0A397TXP3_9GLOM|nr:hypothetical protein C2G38_2230440 [Gigaspora rosea]
MLGAIMDKLNELSEKMNLIERHLFEMDDRFSESFDLAYETNFINQSAKEIAKKLFEYAIYPSNDDLREAAEDYLAENHTKFYDSMTDKNKYF